MLLNSFQSLFQSFECCNVLFWVDSDDKFKESHVNPAKQSVSSQTVTMIFFSWSLGFGMYSFEMPSHGLTFYFWVIMMSWCFISCHNAVNQFVTFFLRMWQKLLANFSSKLSALPSVCKEPILHKHFGTEEHQCEPHIPVKDQTWQQFPSEWFVNCP